MERAAARVAIEPLDDVAAAIAAAAKHPHTHVHDLDRVLGGNHLGRFDQHHPAKVVIGGVDAGDQLFAGALEHGAHRFDPHLHLAETDLHVREITIADRD